MKSQTFFKFKYHPPKKSVAQKELVAIVHVLYCGMAGGGASKESC